MECAVCKSPATAQCSQCQNTSYCGVECQKQDWRSGHALACVGHRAGEPSPPVVLGYVISVGNFTMVRLLTLNEDALYQVGRAYVAERGLGWKVNKPHAWHDYGTGPHVTLAPAMRKYNGEFVDVELGEVFHFTDSPSNWVAFRAKLPEKFVCPHGCHVSIAQQRTSSK